MLLYFVVIEGDHIAQVFVNFDDAETFADECCDTCKVYKTEADLWNFAQVEFTKK
jgi:hypothetical protein